MSAYGKRCPQADRVRLNRGEEDATNAVADGMSPNSLLWPSPHALSWSDGGVWRSTIAVTFGARITLLPFLFVGGISNNRFEAAAILNVRRILKFRRVSAAKRD